MVVPTELVERTVVSKHNSDISTSPLIQKSLYYYMSKFNWDKHTTDMEKIYTDKFLETYKYINKKLGGRLTIIKNKGVSTSFLV